MDGYLYLKAFHLIAVISWMAGMLYLPRLFVYHVDAEKGGELDSNLKVMERRLLRFIMNPAMIISLILGVWLAIEVGVKNMGGWFHVKSLLLFGMFVCHGLFSVHRKQFEMGTNTRSANYFRVINEVPTLLMIAIVILAVVKPF